MNDNLNDTLYGAKITKSGMHYAKKSDFLA